MNTLSGKKVLIVDDNPFNRDGLRLYLSEEGCSILEAGDAETTKKMVQSHTPDVTVLDIVIPLTKESKAQHRKRVGVSLVSCLKKLHPTMGIVLFSAYRDETDRVLDLVKVGIRGIAYKVKGCSADELVKAIKEVMVGGVMLDPKVITTRNIVNDLKEALNPEEEPWVLNAVKQIKQLTEREKDIAQQLATSHSTEGIANVLHLSRKTVENHIGRVYKKLGLDRIKKEAPHLRKVTLLTKAYLIYDLQARGL